MAAIELQTPVVVAAQPEKIFNEVWLSEFHVDAHQPNGKVALRAIMLPARTVDTHKEVSYYGRKEVSLPDFFAVATQEELALMMGIINAIKSRAGL
jgi:hypothetical protein